MAIGVDNIWGIGSVDRALPRTSDLVLREVVDARAVPQYTETGLIYPDALEDIGTIEAKECANCASKEGIDLYVVENKEHGYAQVKTFCKDCWVVVYGEGKYD